MFLRQVKTNIDKHKNDTYAYAYIGPVFNGRCYASAYADDARKTSLNKTNR